MNRSEPTSPRSASTLVILRDGPGGLEVLLTIRPRHLRFMGGAAVFPGGAVSEADRDPRWDKASMLDASSAGELIGEDPRTALGFFVCGLRESFEEVGFLLGEHAAAIERSHAGDAEMFLERCLELEVILATDELVPAGRWVTPLGAPQRFDARFFLVAAPASFEPVPDASEVEECRWLTPRAALDELAEGRLLMAPPTIEMLQRLDAHADVAQAMNSMRGGGVREPGQTITTRLSPLVQVVLAPNPSIMTGPGTNTYVVGTGPYVVVDPAVADAEFIATVRGLAPHIESIVVTHRHEDHVGGIGALVADSGDPVRAYGSMPAGGVAVETVSDGDVIEFGGGTLRAIHTPGHSSDHLCLLLEGAASLFSGDSILGEGTAVIAPPDGNMRDYLASLERLRSMDIDRIYPGHLRSLDGGRAVIEGYIAHRRMREEAIRGALSAEWRPLDEIVSAAYIDTPQTLHGVARFSALAHLEMLEEDGAVERDGDQWRLVQGH